MHIKNLYIPNSIIAAVIVLLALNVLLLYISPEKIVETIGVSNSYLTVFLIASLGGLSSVTSTFLYGAIATFASGGAIPWLLGIIGGIGIAIGDSIIFALISYGVKDVSGTWRQRINIAREWIHTHPSWLVYVVLFLILGVSPLPNDIVLFALVLLGFQYLKIAPILLAAGISIATITAYLGESLFNAIF